MKVVERTKNSLLCKWTYGKDNGSRISSCILQVCEKAEENWLDVFTGRGKQYNINKLKPQTSYKIRVASINEYGQRLVKLLHYVSIMNVKNFSKVSKSKKFYKNLKNFEIKDFLKLILMKYFWLDL